MFQDLVEAQILYGAIFNNEKTLQYDSELFDHLTDIFAEICPDCPDLQKMIQVREVDQVYYWMDAVSNHAVCGIEKEHL